MHPDRNFRIEDQETLLAFLHARPFVTLCAAVNGMPVIAQSPILVRDIGHEVVLDFHLSRGSALGSHIVQGFRAIALALGSDAYISPDGYEIADQVPTWNYVSVEAEGMVAPLDHDELVAQLDALSEQEEARLAPKRPWTRAKMSPGRFELMLRNIVGGRLVVERLQGTFKLSQNKADVDRLGAARALGDHPISVLMRNARA